MALALDAQMGALKTSLIIILVIWTNIPDAVSQSYTTETTLRSTLSSGYNRFVRPSTTTNVTLYYNLRTLQVLDITEQQMTLTGWLTANWEDQRLVWDNSNLITQIEINWGWRPEFVVSNSADGFAKLGFTNDETRLIVHDNGLVKWNQLLHTTTSCAVDITSFPFDSQSCDIEIKFWGYAVEEVSITNQYTTVQTGVYIENAEWQLDSSSVMNGMVTLCCPDTNHTVYMVTLNFTRRRPFYVMNLIFPTVLLSICLVWVFLLPTESGERIGYTLTILLAYVVQLSIIADMMPTTSQQIPYIARYLLIVLVLCFVVTCNIVLHVKLYYTEGPVPKWLESMYRKVHPIVYLKCCSSKKGKPPGDKNSVDDISKSMTVLNFHKKDIPLEEVTSNEEDEQQEEVTWIKVANAMDRICFCMYVIAVTVVNGTFFSSIA